MPASPSRDKCVSAVARWAAGGAFLLSCVPNTGAQAPAEQHKDITYILPIWPSFTIANSEDIATEVEYLRSHIGEGPYVKVGFTAYVFVNMTDWTVDITNPAAVRTALSSTFAQIDSYGARGNAAGIPICLNILLPSRSRTDPVQLAAEAEDLRNMQWYGSANGVATGWVRHLRYARKGGGVP